ncbi:MAG: LysR family transcriptional regulator [Actinomycetota bacterium]
MNLAERRQLDLRALETFRAVAANLSFTRAADELGLAQSTVSAHVAALEDELGVPLFDRLGRRIALTDAGESLVGYAERLLHLEGEARTAVTDLTRAKGEVTGSIVVSAPETLLTYRLPPLLSKVHARHPGVRITLRPSVIGRLVGEVLRGVMEGVVDVAFVMDEPRRVEGLAIEPLVREPVSVIAGRGHPLGSGRRVPPEALRGQTVLLPEAPQSGCAYRAVFERQLAAAGAAPNDTLEFASVEAVKGCVIAGMGVSALPTVAVRQEVKAGRLMALRWSEPFEVVTQMVWREGRWLSPAMRAFLETARTIYASSRSTG